MILSSTSEVYGKTDRIPSREHDRRIMGTTSQRRWAYACSKALDEYMALAYWYEHQLPVIIIRFFNIIGPRQTGRYGMVVPTFVRQALLGRPLTIFGDGRQSRSFSYIGDAIEGILDLASHPQAIGEIFNLGSSEEITIEELAQLVKEKARSLSPIHYLPYDSVLGEDFEDIYRRIPDISKIRALTGYSPKVRLDEAIERIIQYHIPKKAHGMRISLGWADQSSSESPVASIHPRRADDHGASACPPACRRQTPKAHRWPDGRI
jgi:UDP-glucose 4-epimerase